MVAGGGPNTIGEDAGGGGPSTMGVLLLLPLGDSILFGVGLDEGCEVIGVVPPSASSSAAKSSAFGI